jgi:predicted nucleotidyltransferase
MATQIPAEQMEQYKRTARARRQCELSAQKARRERAWQLAREAARLLREVYGAQRVVVFGSLIAPDRFTPWSDVDMAAWGLTSANWLRAIAAVRSLSDDIELNLVDVECCSPEI